MLEPTCLTCGDPTGPDKPTHYGRCVQCLAELKERPQALKLDSGVLVRVTYHPGFAQDLTSWDTCIFHSGLIEQTIHWDEPVHGNARDSVLTAQLDGKQLAKVNELLAEIDLACLAVFKCWMCVCDAPFVHLFSPCHNLHVTVDQYGLHDDDMPNAARIGVKQFQAAWNFIDSISPYAIATHYQ